MKKLITVLFVGSFSLAQGQNKTCIEIGASIFGIRQFQELPSYHQSPENQYNKNKYYLTFPKGIVINFVGNNLRTTIELNYYNEKNTLDGTICKDCIEGNGQLKGFETKLGIYRDYEFGQFNVSPGISTYLLSSKVVGNYIGGRSWPKWQHETYTKHIGINPSISFGFGGFKPILISIETGVFLGKLYGADIDSRFSTESFFSPIQSISLRYKIK